MPPLLEFEQTEKPFRDLRAVRPVVQKQGIVQVPDKPGLGIEIDRSVIERFRVA